MLTSSRYLKPFSVKASVMHVRLFGRELFLLGATGLYGARGNGFEYLCTKPDFNHLIYGKLGVMLLIQPCTLAYLEHRWIHIDVLGCVFHRHEICIGF